MNLPYIWRMVCLCLACFFLAHLALSALVGALSGRAIRRAERMRSTSAATFLIVLRLLPSLLSLAIAGGLALPGYLLLEPEEAVEEIGLIGLMAASLAAAAWVYSGVRAGRIWLHTERFLRSCNRVISIAGLPQLCQGPAGAPALMLAGVRRPRLIISDAALAALSPDELAAAVGHECSHERSRDNLKKLLLILTPRPLLFRGRLAQLEREWSRYAERAADDRAAAGDPARAASLASALLRVARLETSAPPPFLATTLIADGCELVERVERLLEAPASDLTEPKDRRKTVILLGLLAATLGVAAPALLALVHGLLEDLMR